MKTILQYIKDIILKNCEDFDTAKKKVSEFLRYAKTNGTLSTEQFDAVKQIAEDMLSKLAMISKYDIDGAIKNVSALSKIISKSKSSCGDEPRRSTSRCGTYSSSNCGPSGRGC